MGKESPGAPDDQLDEVGVDPHSHPEANDRFSDAEEEGWPAREE